MTWEEAKREMMFAKRNVLEGSYIDQAYDKAIEALSQLERKRGKWIGIDDYPYESWECDQCGCVYEEIGGWTPDYCPCCGAMMKDGDEE